MQYEIICEQCGAFDGEQYSNTLALELNYNWTGVLVEADPSNFAVLLLLHLSAILSLVFVYEFQVIFY